MNPSTAIRLGRLSDLPTVWTNVLAGAVLSGGPLETVPIAAAAVSGSALHIGALVLDHDERPEHPQHPAAWRWGLGLLVLGTLAAWGVHRFAGLAALATSAAIVYGTRFKAGSPGPLLMGGCRMGVYALGGFAVSAAPSPMLWVGSLVLLGYVLTLTSAAGVGRRRGMARWGPLLGLAGPGAFVLASWSGAPLIPSFLGGYGLWVHRAISRIRSAKPQMIRVGVVHLIAGIALLDALVVANSGATSLAMACLGLFGLTLALQSRFPGP